MPRDAKTGWVEPDITVNGRALTFAECMAVRVAIGSFLIGLSSDEMRRGLGEGLAAGYETHLVNVERAMMPGFQN